MYSLYHSLVSQHPRELNPVRCGESTIAQLHNYFEEVVLENNLGALVVESLRPSVDRSARELLRVKELSRVAEGCFLIVTPEDRLSKLMLARGKEDSGCVILDKTDDENSFERFVVIADGRFSALLASVHNGKDNEDTAGDLVVWTFDPDIVYSALEYLMARVTAEHPFHAYAFANAVSVSMPKATSLHLTLGVTTKLARLLQQQAEREIAVNRIATAIRNSPTVEGVLQTAADEVGRALNVQCCVVRAEGQFGGREVTKCHFRSDVDLETVDAEMLGDLDELSTRFSQYPKTFVVDGDQPQAALLRAHVVVPLVYQGNCLGFLLVRTDDAVRVWADNEVMLLNTVADQLAIAVNQAHLFAQMKQQALTDELTGCSNRRSFDLQLDRDLHFATRMRQPLTLIMLDLDNFKDINDHAGHETGDLALRILSDALRAEIRSGDSAVRFGGDEFAVILPRADLQGALIAAERLRIKIESTEVPGYGRMTASFGLASFPLHASSHDTLIAAADRALYNSKHSGRNRVSIPPEEIPQAVPATLEDAVPEEAKLVDSLQIS